jgi:hypothetical protein
VDVGWRWGDVPWCREVIMEVNRWVNTGGRGRGGWLLRDIIMNGSRKIPSSPQEELN